MKILIVEDDKIIRDILKKELTKWGYEVELVEDFNNVLQDVKAFSPDLILLDIVLPNFNGFYFCEQIRVESTVPIIFLSSKNENMDIVMAMQMGGDEYITKPIELDILVAKVQALLRRSYDYVSGEVLLNYGGLVLNIGTSTINFNKRYEELTNTEFMIMKELVLAKGMFVSRNKLIESCWKSSEFIDDNTLAVNISRIRSKLSDIGMKEVLVTKRGRGYALRQI